MMKKAICLLLAACFSLCAVFCAAEEEAGQIIQCEGIAGPYQWLNYELTVDTVRVLPSEEVLKGPGNENPPTDTMLEVRLLGGEDGILYADITEDNLKKFALRDAAGEEIPLYSMSCWGVGFDKETATFSTFDVQEGFLLYYFLPDGTNAEELVLTV